jgi:signal transduction histidine kinase
MHAPRQIDAETQRFETWLRWSGVGLWEVDLSGVSTYANAAMLALLEVPSMSELGPRAYHQAFGEDFENFRDGRSAGRMANVVGALGKQTSGWIQGGPIANADGSVRGVLMSFTPDSDLQRAHEAQRMKALQLMAGGMAHDFNNLLMPILTFSETPNPNDVPELLSDLQAVFSAATKATYLTRDLSRFAGHSDFKWSVLSLRDEIEAHVDTLQHEAGPTLQVKLELAPTPAVIRGDATAIREALSGLVGYARAVVPKGGTVVIQTGSRSDGWEGVPSGPFVELRVILKKTLFEAASLATLFEPFSSMEARGVSGLGLPLVWGIVTQHQAFIRATSSAETGTCFVMLWPSDD